MLTAVLLHLFFWMTKHHLILPHNPKHWDNHLKLSTTSWKKEKEILSVAPTTSALSLKKEKALDGQRHKRLESHCGVTQFYPLAGKSTRWLLVKSYTFFFEGGILISFRATHRRSHEGGAHTPWAWPKSRTFKSDYCFLRTLMHGLPIVASL